MPKWLSALFSVSFLWSSVQPAVALEGYSYRPGVGTLIFSDSPSYLRLAIPTDYLTAVLKKTVHDSLNSYPFTVKSTDGTQVLFTEVGDSNVKINVRVTGKYDDHLSTFFDASCRATIYLTIPKAPIPNADAKVRVDAPFCEFNNVVSIIGAPQLYMIDALLEMAKKLRIEEKLLNNEDIAHHLGNRGLAPYLAWGMASANYCLDKHDSRSVCVNYE